MRTHYKIIRFKGYERHVDSITCVVWLEMLAAGDRGLSDTLTLDSVDDLIDLLIGLLEDARDQRYVLAPPETEG